MGKKLEMKIITSQSAYESVLLWNFLYALRMMAPKWIIGIETKIAVCGMFYVVC